MKISTQWLVIINNIHKQGFTSSLQIPTISKNYSVELSNYFKNLLFTKKISYLLLKNFVMNNLRNLKLFSEAVGIRWFRFVLFSGLGYKRRVFKKYKIMFAYVGDRHWIIYKLKDAFGIFSNRRRNYIFFSKTKSHFIQDYEFFCSIKKPQVYKMKGFLDTRVRGRFLFVRRIKIRGVKTKLSKKQQLL